jgi:hypothetical protein
MSPPQGADERHAPHLDMATYVLFSEATAHQETACDEFAASAFGHPLSALQLYGTKSLS